MAQAVTGRLDGAAVAPVGMVAVQVASIEEALTQSWRSATSKDGSVLTHACALTLIVWAEADSDCRDVVLVVDQLAGKHPIRAIVLGAAETSDGDSVAAWFSRGCEGEGRESICSEQILLHANAHAPELLVSAVRGLLVPDLPVYLWWRDGSPFGNNVFSELRKMADRVVVDSIRFGDGAAALDTLRRLVQQGAARATVRDLNWQRTEPWRNAIAACFDDPDILALLPVFNRCSVTYASSGDSSASARSLLMYAWLVSRLQALRGHGKIAPGKHWNDVASGRIVAITLTSSTCKSTLMLVRQQSPTAIAAEAHARDGVLLKRWQFAAASLSEAHLLDRCIDALGRDAVFEAALGTD